MSEQPNYHTSFFITDPQDDDLSITTMVAVHKGHDSIRVSLSPEQADSEGHPNIITDKFMFIFDLDADDARLLIRALSDAIVTIEEES